MNDRDLHQHWLTCVARSDVRDALEAVYTTAAFEIAARGPACWASGRCCNFQHSGHQLYVTGLEAAYTLALLPEIAGARPENHPEPALRSAALAQARVRGGCPFQAANLCGVHAIKPLGCRLYFCDRTAQEWQHVLTERLLGEVRAIHDRFAIEYRYGEWREMLGMFVL